MDDSILPLCEIEKCKREEETKVTMRIIANNNKVDHIRKKKHKFPFFRPRGQDYTHDLTGQNDAKLFQSPKKSPVNFSLKGPQKFDFGEKEKEKRLYKRWRSKMK